MTNKNQTKRNFGLLPSREPPLDRYRPRERRLGPSISTASESTVKRKQSDVRGEARKFRAILDSPVRILLKPRAFFVTFCKTLPGGNRWDGEKSPFAVAGTAHFLHAASRKRSPFGSGRSLARNYFGLL